MKRSALLPRGTLGLLLACAGLSGACSSSTTTTGVAGLSGTYDVVLSNDLVFVTSSDDDALKVLDLSADPKDFVPAPNPLQALSIPVVERPNALTRDMGFVDGADTAGPYVYARSSGSSKISVVAADRNRLKQVGDPLDAGALVTAFAARAPAGEGAPSVLYYAVQTPPSGVTGFACPNGAVLRQELPGPDVLATAVPPAPVPVFCLNPREAVSALLVMPQAGQLVVATRSTNNLPPALLGRTLLLTESATGGLASVSVDLGPGFEGSPVRMLATHPQVVRIPDNKDTPNVDETVRLPAGQFVYGVRDESACGAAAQCSGILAVDSTTGARANDLTGAPMLPITVPGLPTGMAIIPYGVVKLTFTDNTSTNATVPLLGIIPSSTGSISIIQASDPREFDLNPNAASVSVELRDVTEAAVDRGITDVSSVVSVAQTVEYTNPADPARKAVRRTLFEGSVVGNTYRIVYQGIFPTMASLERDLSQPTLFEVDQYTDPQQKVAPDDIIVLEGDNEVCATDLVVSAVTPTGTGNRVRLETTTPIPDICADLPRFTVRAAGKQPFILINASGDLLSRRIAPDPDTGEELGYAIPTSYFYHPDGFGTATVQVDDVANVPPEPWTVPAFPPTPPDLVIRVAVPSAANRLTRSDRFLVTVSSGVQPFSFGVDTATTLVGLSFYTLPGPVAARPGGNLAYIAYPSADGILQVNLTELVPNALNSRALDPKE